ncbi:hypothetical protein ACS15_3015 [Ralstonia insidiosa]|uniref:Uncharacterized protein n=1 Tax=Ralstonia insidiosa TaxID=190721 RepID=A0AAC9BJS6_9RALS|nr:hypothetical protein ACS15_3015 [Ralstonia insidiosa]
MKPSAGRAYRASARASLAQTRFEKIRKGDLPLRKRSGLRNRRSTAWQRESCDRKQTGTMHSPDIRDTR